MEPNIIISSDVTGRYDDIHSDNQSTTVSVVVSKGCVIKSIETENGELK